VKNIREVSFITSILFSWLFLQSSEVRAREALARQYSGIISELETSMEASNYVFTRGFFIKDNNTPSKVNLSLMANQWCLRDVEQPNRFKKCVYAIQTLLERDLRGKPKFRTEAALEFSLASDFQILDEDENCHSRFYPDKSIIAIGRWKWRNKPLVGGYSYYIRQAWAVDANSRKFVEIQAKEVRCNVITDSD
jgi:hypothetical protein